LQETLNFTGISGGDPSRSTTQRKFNWLDRQTVLSAFTEPKALFPALANRLGAGYRDRPLTFQWQSPRGFVDALGLPAARNGVGGFRSKASDWRYFLNGTQIFNTGTNTVGWTTAPRIGSSGDGDNISGFPGFNVNYYEGYIAEVVLLSEFAGTSDWQKVEGYLAWKWGLQSDLDAAHPYKSAAP
jgi:hypothetical protein